MASDSERNLEELFTSYVDRLNDGEELDAEKILAENPIMGVEILDYLEDYIAAAPTTNEENQPLGTLGDYTLRRQIGRGGMGVVYEAWEGSMDRAVALKVLPPGVAADNKAFTRFMREAKTAGQLHHQNIVGVYSTGVKQGTPWYSMELVEGETLAQIVGRIREIDDSAATPFGPRSRQDYCIRLADAFADVADGLQHAHSKGVVHRDIKPSNLILDAEADQGGRPKLRILDFGLARLEGQETLTLSGDLIGTVLYMSPEQAMAKRIPLDHRTDVYSLGATMYEALCGRPPFRGKDHADTLSQIIERDPVEPRKVNPRVPKDLETIVLKCLRKDAGDRYGTAEALEQDLKRIVRGDPIEARPESRTERLLRTVWRHRLKVLVTALGCLLLSIAVALGLRNAALEREGARSLYDSGTREALIKLYRAHLLLGDRKDYLVVDGRKRLVVAYSSRLSRGRAVVKEALEALTELRESFPSRTEGYYYSIRAHLLALEYDQAQKVLELGMARCEDASTLKVFVGELGMDGSVRVAGVLPVDRWVAVRRAARQAEVDVDWNRAASAYDELLSFVDVAGEPYVGAEIEFRVDRGLARLEAGAPDRALLDFAAAWSDCGQCLEVMLLIGKALCEMGNVESAERLFEDAVANLDHEGRNELAVLIASLFEELGEEERASIWAARAGGGYDVLRTAKKLYFQGRYRAAAELFRPLLKSNPTDFQCLQGLGFSLYEDIGGRAGPQREREIDELFRVAKTAADQYPQELQFHSLLARVYLERGEIEKALAAAETAWRAAKESKRGGTIALGALSAAYLARGDLEKAEESARTAFDMGENKAPGYALNLVAVLRRSGKYAEAEQVLRASLAQHPQDARLYGRLAELALRREKFDDALKLCEKATGLYPVNSSVAESHVLALLALDRAQEAQEIVEAALGRVPDRPRLHHVHGLVLERLRDMDGARTAFERVLELAPRYSEATDIRQRIARTGS